MADIKQIIKCEYDSITTPFQKKLHLINDEDEHVNMSSAYTSDFPDKVPFRSNIERNLQCSATEDKTSYTVNPIYMETLDVLEDLVMTTLVPRIQLRKQFQDTHQIKWKPHLCHEMIEMCEFRIDSDTKQTHTSNTLAIYRNYLLPKQFDRTDYLASIGNVDHLTTWNIMLPPEDLNWYQPWPFSESKAKALPIFMCPKSVVNFDYVYELNVNKLLLARKLVDGKYIEIPFENRFIEKIDNGYKMKRPKIRGFFAKLTDDERDYKAKHPSGRILNYYDFIVLDNGNSIRPYFKDTISLTNVYPLKSIFILPINLSSYTKIFTHGGYGIISSVEITYQLNKKKLEKCTTNFIKNILSKNYPRKPFEEGLGGIPFANYFNAVNCDFSVSPNNEMNAQMIIEYSNTDPYLREDEKEKSNENDEDEIDDNLSDKGEVSGVKINKNSGMPRFNIVYIHLISKQLEFINGACVNGV